MCNIGNTEPKKLGVSPANLLNQPCGTTHPSKSRTGNHRILDPVY